MISILLSFLLLFSSTELISDASNVFLDAGGWMLNDTQLLSSYRSQTQFRIALEKIVGYGIESKPIVKTLDLITLPINPKLGKDYFILGALYCTPKTDPKMVVALMNDKPYKAWTIIKNKFKSISTKGIKCDLESLRE